MTGRLALTAVQFVVLLAVLLMLAQRQVPAAFHPVDSYVCIRAERSPAVNPGCQTNTIEKGVR